MLLTADEPSDPSGDTELERGERAVRETAVGLTALEHRQHITRHAVITNITVEVVVGCHGA